MDAKAKEALDFLKQAEGDLDSAIKALMKSESGDEGKRNKIKDGIVSLLIHSEGRDKDPPEPYDTLTELIGELEGIDE